MSCESAVFPIPDFVPPYICPSKSKKASKSLIQQNSEAFCEV